MAKEDNISGVHTAANLLNKRLPVMARLVANPSASSPSSSQLPVTSNNGGTLKTASAFANEMRMLAALDEDFVVGLVLSPQGGKECGQAVPIPLPALIKVPLTHMMSTDRFQTPFPCHCHDHATYQYSSPHY